MTKLPTEVIYSSTCLHFTVKQAYYRLKPRPTRQMLRPGQATELSCIAPQGASQADVRANRPAGSVSFPSMNGIGDR